MKRLILLLALGAAIAACTPADESPGAPVDTLPPVGSPAVESPALPSPAVESPAAS